MDLLFKRYASPFSFIDGMLSTGRFFDFVVEFVQTVNKERNTERAWEAYLHSAYEGSFDDFMSEIENSTKNQEMSAQTMETTIQNSLNILKTFTPNGEGGEDN